MGKVKLAKNFAMLFVLASFVMLAGCNTAAGFGKGVGCAVGSTAEGVAKDSVDIAGGVMAADNWMRENLW